MNPVGSVGADAFAASRDRFEALCRVLGGEGAGGLEHGELEELVSGDGRQLLLPAIRDTDQVAHASVEAGHHRALQTVFGELDVARLAYRHRGTQNLHPADAVLNLPVER